MPEAPAYLRAMFDGDQAAFAALGSNYCVTRGGVIMPRGSHSPTERERAAIHYLILEWDYAYDSGNAAQKDTPA